MQWRRLVVLAAALSAGAPPFLTTKLTVTDQHGRPIRQASVRLWGVFGSYGMQEQHVTDAYGTVLIERIAETRAPDHGYRIEVSAPGWVDQRALIPLYAGQPNQARIALAQRTVPVRGTLSEVPDYCDAAVVLTAPGGVPGEAAATDYQRAALRELTLDTGGHAIDDDTGPFHVESAPGRRRVNVVVGQAVNGFAGFALCDLGERAVAADGGSRFRLAVPAAHAAVRLTVANLPPDIRGWPEAQLNRLDNGEPVALTRLASRSGTGGWDYVAPGDYTLAIRAHETFGLRQRLRLRAGEQAQLALTYPAYQSLELNVVERATGEHAAPVWASLCGERAIARGYSPSGHLVLRCVPAGNYTLRWGTPRLEGTRELEVGDQPVTLRLER